MVTARFLIAGFVAAASASSFVAREDAYFASLLKRQEPGTPAYNCHDNCGSAITLSRGADPCNNAVFVADYNNCLKCSGPDNFNIWRYYGGTLSSAGEKCGLDTEPLAGKQEDVPEAGSNSATSSAAAQPSGTSPVAAPSSSASSSAAVSTGSQTAATTDAATSEAPFSSAITPSPAITTFDSSVAASESLYPTVVANQTLSSFVSGAPSTSTNASASFTASAPAEVTTNAAAGIRAADAAGVFGAVFIGALLGM